MKIKQLLFFVMFMTIVPDYVHSAAAPTLSPEEELERLMTSFRAEVGDERYNAHIEFYNDILDDIRGSTRYEFGESCEYTIFNDLSRVKAEDYIKFSLAYARLTAAHPSAYDYIISSLSLVDSKNYRDFEEAVKKLYKAIFSGSTRDDREKYSHWLEELLPVISKAIPLNCQEVINTAKALLPEEYDWDDVDYYVQKFDIIGSVCEVDPKNYKKLISTIKTLLKGMNWGEIDDNDDLPMVKITRVICAVVDDVDFAHHQDFISLISAISHGMNAGQKSDIIFRIARREGRDYYGTMAALGSQITNVETRETVLHRFAQLTPEQRALRTARALLFARWIGGAEARGQRILQVLETDLNIDVPEFGAEAAVGPNPYAVGVNVHTAGRDKKTRYAFDLLRSLYKPEKNDSATRFTAINLAALVSHVKFHDTADKIATRVLLGGKNGIELLPGCWGSLLGDKRGEMGLYDGPSQNIIPNETLLAHLWNFITFSIMKEEETEQAKEALMTALRNAKEENGEGVCNSGKYQRIATAVLQGRLQGVSIDSAPIPADAELVEVEDIDLLNAAYRACRNRPVTKRKVIRQNSKQIEHHLQDLLARWQEEVTRPKTRAEMFRQAFDFLQQNTLPLDPRYVVFFLTFGHGIDDATPSLDPELSWYGMIEAEGGAAFALGDYIGQYQPREQQAYRDAKAEAADMAKQAVEAEAERIREEAAAKMAEEQAAREEAIQKERARLASLTPEQRRQEMADSYRGLAAGSAAGAAAGSADQHA